ncbi:MAG: MerR family transcriptional regulator [Gaiellaceae bacterium]
MKEVAIAEAARATGWSPRMLRYLEAAGILVPPRTPSAYRLYGPHELELLRRLDSLRKRFRLALTDIAFAARLRRETELRRELENWLEDARTDLRQRPPSAWLDWEQRKHERLMAA